MSDKTFPELAAEFTAWERGEFQSDAVAVELLKGYALKVRELNAMVAQLNDLDGTMWGDVASHFACTEASVIADLLAVLGLQSDAELLMTSHYYGGYDGADEEQEVEMHSDSEGVRDERIVPSIMFGDGPAPY